MKHLTFSAALLVICALAAGCADTTPTALDPGAARFNKKGGGNVDTDSRAIWEWFGSMPDGTTPTGIRGDGRLANGSGAANDPSEYQGDLCGVHAKIFWHNASASQSGDAVFDPDGNPSGKCAPRKLTFDLGAGSRVVSGPFTNVGKAMQLEVASSRDQDMGFRDNGISNCEILRFGHEGKSSQVRVTRLDANPTGPRQWRVESLPPHMARCWNSVKGTLQPNGPEYTLPFHVVITEVPYGS